MDAIDGIFYEIGVGYDPIDGTYGYINNNLIILRRSSFIEQKIGLKTFRDYSNIF